MLAPDRSRQNADRAADTLFRFVPDTDLTSPRKAALYTSDLNNPLRYEDPDGASPNLFVSFAPAEKLAVRAANYAASFVSLQRDGVESEGVIVDHYIGRELASNPIFNFFNSLDDSPGRGAAEPLGDDTAAQVFANAADHLENFGLPTGPPGSTPGGEPGSRAGKEFTGTAKKVIEENNPKCKRRFAQVRDLRREGCDLWTNQAGVDRSEERQAD